MPDLGQQPLQQRDLHRPPAIRGHRIAETPGYVGAIRRPVQAHVQALLVVAPTQEVVVAREATGAVIDLQDLPASVQVDDPNPGILQQGGRGRGPRPGPDQRLPDAHKVPDLGQQPLQQRDLHRPPAIRGHRIAETPGYVGAIRPVQAHVQALLVVAPTQEVVVAR